MAEPFSTYTFVCVKCEAEEETLVVKRGRRRTVCDQCQRDNMRELQRRRPPRKRKDTVYLPRDCLVCGASFRPKRAGRVGCCSRECGFIFAGHKRALKGSGGRVVVSVERGRCAHCSGPFTKGRFKRFCSQECCDSYWRAYQETKARAKHEPRRYVCAECRRQVVADYGNKKRRFCSDECSRRNGRRKAHRMARARLRAVNVETVDPTLVFDRDGWRCQLCGGKTLKAKRGTYHDKAPELDHIVPLADGGEHSYRNTQCACRACNMKKSNGPGGQLLLFGDVA